MTPFSKAFLKLDKTYLNGLDGLEEYSHIWLISWLHRSEPISKFKIQPPRMNKEKLGVFATRSPHRPNPLGLTLAKIEKVEKDGIWLSGVDLINGTPIIDIKPYVPRYDSVEATTPPWINEDQTLDVQMEESFFKDLSHLDLPSNTSEAELVGLIQDTFKQDPRPRVYKARSEAVYYVLVYDFDVRCEFKDKVFRVTGISKATHPL